MKKFILICTALIGGVTYFTPAIDAAQIAPTHTVASVTLPDDAKGITVYKVVQVAGNKWSTSPKSAYYSPSENCIYVTEGRRENQPYTVYENRAYGQSQDGRGDYHYTAGGYYFDL